jgi:hypothetical protein
VSDGITYCADCANCLRPTKTAPPWKWLCLMHPRIEGYGFVTRTTWDTFEPYLYCRDCNGGRCVLFEKADPKQMKLMIEDDHG